MKLTIHHKCPFKAYRDIPLGEAREWINRLVLALCNTHRQLLNTAWATKFHFPLGKSGVPGLTEWCKTYQNYSWAQRLLAQLTHRYNLNADKPHPHTILARVILCHCPPAAMKQHQRETKGKDWREGDGNPLVPPGLAKAPWLSYEPDDGPKVRDRD